MAAACVSRQRTAHLLMLSKSKTCRPTALLQHRQRRRSRSGHWSRPARAAEQLAHLCSCCIDVGAAAALAKTALPLTGDHVARSAPELNGYVAACVLHIPVESPDRGAAGRTSAASSRLWGSFHPHPLAATRALVFFSPLSADMFLRGFTPRSHCECCESAANPRESAANLA